jgi:transcriptional regulator with XRE-family HTH domain
VDDLQVGALARAVRHRHGWTQEQLGERAHVSQQLVSLFERGHLDRMVVASVRRICAALEIQLPFAPRWRGGDGARLLDSDHAVLVNFVAGELRSAGWGVLAEYTFNVYGERGSVDVIGWHAATHCLLLVEVKSRMVDTQDTLATLDRKSRLLPRLLVGDRGWHAMAVGVVLVMPGSTANRSAVDRHGSTFTAALPTRAPEIRRWIRRPEGPLRGIWFVSPTTLGSGTAATLSRRRVRRPRSRSMESGARADHHQGG